MKYIRIVYIIAYILNLLFFRVNHLERRKMSGKSFQEMLDTVLVDRAAQGDVSTVAMLLSQGGRVDTMNKDSI